MTTCGAGHRLLPSYRGCDEAPGHEPSPHVVLDGCGRPEYYWPSIDPLAGEVVAVPAMDDPRLELANIRRLLTRHGVAPADGNGVLRSTVAMVEELIISRPPR